MSTIKTKVFVCQLWRMFGNHYKRADKPLKVFSVENLLRSNLRRLEAIYIYIYIYIYIWWNYTQLEGWVTRVQSSNCFILRGHLAKMLEMPALYLSPVYLLKGVHLDRQQLTLSLVLETVTTRVRQRVTAWQRRGGQGGWDSDRQRQTATQNDKEEGENSVHQTRLDPAGQRKVFDLSLEISSSSLCEGFRGLSVLQITREVTLHQQWLATFPSQEALRPTISARIRRESRESADKPAATWLPARQICSLNKSHWGRGHIADLYSSMHTLPGVNLCGVH